VIQTTPTFVIVVKASTKDYRS